MNKRTDELSLLDQHIFKQNQNIIEMSARLDKFLSKTDSAVEFAEAKASERNNAIKWSVVGVLCCAAIFGVSGYVLRMGADAVSLSNARDSVKEANIQLEVEKKRVDEAIALLEKKSADEVARIRAISGWAGTREGHLAKQFFEVGGGAVAAECKSEVWDIVENKEGKWCFPQRRTLLGDDKRFGWKIP